ncbi:MAG: DUF6765 family protein [bacterium]
MNISFHYFVVRILAEKAGFNANEAQIIAYASQYTDDSVAHKEITINNIPTQLFDVSFVSRRIKGNLFNPICSAHRDIEYLSYEKIGVQRGVYTSFHFLPAELYKGQTDYNYVVLPNGNFARSVIAKAKEALVKQKNEKNLIKLGIALHTFADNWAHQGFSGRHNDENDVDRLWKLDGNSTKEITPLNIAPDVGHAEALTFPDKTNLLWMIQYANNSKIKMRNNPFSFLDSAKTIYGELISITGAENTWDVFSEKIKTFLEQPKGNDSYPESFAASSLLFPDISFGYDENEWKKLAITGNVYDWKGKHFERDMQNEIFNFNGDLKWFFFHEAALEQRDYVYNNINVNLN